jgi:hypothetical protein
MAHKMFTAEQIQTRSIVTGRCCEQNQFLEGPVAITRFNCHQGLRIVTLGALPRRCQCVAGALLGRCRGAACVRPAR